MFGQAKKISEPKSPELKQAEKDITKGLVKTVIGVSSVAVVAGAIAPVVPAVAATVATIAVVGTGIKVAAKLKVASDKRKSKQS